MSCIKDDISVNLISELFKKKKFVNTYMHVNIKQRHIILNTDIYTKYSFVHTAYSYRYADEFTTLHSTAIKRVLVKSFQLMQVQYISVYHYVIFICT